MRSRRAEGRPSPPGDSSARARARLQNHQPRVQANRRHHSTSLHSTARDTRRQNPHRALRAHDPRSASRTLGRPVFRIAFAVVPEQKQALATRRADRRRHAGPTQQHGCHRRHVDHACARHRSRDRRQEARDAPAPRRRRRSSRRRSSRRRRRRRRGAVRPARQEEPQVLLELGPHARPRGPPLGKRPRRRRRRRRGRPRAPGRARRRRRVRAPRRRQLPGPRRLEKARRARARGAVRRDHGAPGGGVVRARGGPRQHRPRQHPAGDDARDAARGRGPGMEGGRGSGGNGGNGRGRKRPAPGTQRRGSSRTTPTRKTAPTRPPSPTPARAARACARPRTTPSSTATASPPASPAPPRRSSAATARCARSPPRA